jgi:hypothetical protein
MSYFVVRRVAGGAEFELVCGSSFRAEAERAVEATRRTGDWAGIYEAPVGAVALRLAAAERTQAADRG